jgi:hypothetical protein
VLSLCNAGHRKLYPFAGGETRKAKLHDAGFSWFPAHVPYQRFAEQSELSLKQLFDVMMPVLMMDVEDLFHKLWTCSSLTRASCLKIQAAMQTKLKMLQHEQNAQPATLPAAQPVRCPDDDGNLPAHGEGNGMSQRFLIVGPLVIVRNNIYNVFRKKCTRSGHLNLSLKLRTYRW